MRYYWCDWMLYTVSPFLGPIRRWMSNSSLASRLNWQIKLIINWTFRHITFTIHYRKLKQTKEEKTKYNNNDFLSIKDGCDHLFILVQKNEKINQLKKLIVSNLNQMNGVAMADGWTNRFLFERKQIFHHFLLDVLVFWLLYGFGTSHLKPSSSFEIIQQFWNHPALLKASRLTSSTSEIIR